MFAGVVGGFELHRACPGLTLVTRERGIVGNLIASFGSGFERVGLEDPVFERRFEVYGSDQVWARHRPHDDDARAVGPGRREGVARARLPLRVRRSTPGDGAFSACTGAHPCGACCFLCTLG